MTETIFMLWLIVGINFTFILSIITKTKPKWYDWIVGVVIFTPLFLILGVPIIIISGGAEVFQK